MSSRPMSGLPIPAADSRACRLRRGVLAFLAISVLAAAARAQAIATDKPRYTPGDQITVTCDGLPVGGYCRVSLAVRGSRVDPDQHPVKQGQSPNGRYAAIFAGLGVNKWEARLFLWTGTWTLKRSVDFDVAAAPPPSPPTTKDVFKEQGAAFRDRLIKKGLQVIYAKDGVLANGRRSTVNLGAQFDVGYSYAVLAWGDPEKCQVLDLLVEDGAGNKMPSQVIKTRDPATGKEFTPRWLGNAVASGSNQSFVAKIRMVCDAASCRWGVLVARKADPVGATPSLDKPTYQHDTSRERVVFSVPGRLTDFVGSKGLLQLSFQFFDAAKRRWVDGPGSHEDDEDRQRWRHYRDHNGYAVARSDFQIRSDPFDLGRLAVVMPYDAFNLDDDLGPFRVRARARLFVNGKEIAGASPYVEFRVHD